MIRKVLVAMDGSKHANKALGVAIELARTARAEITILNVVSDKPLIQGEIQLARAEFRSDVDHVLNRPHAEGDGGVATAEELTAASQAVGMRIREAIGQRLVETGAAEARVKGVSKASTRVELGDPAATILATASEEQPDFIVMGTRGLGSMAGLVFGSVSHRVVQLASCSVVTVK